MTENPNSQSEAGCSGPQQPNWAFLAACCAFAAPAGCAATGILYSALLGFRYGTPNIIVFLLAVSAFTLLILDWRRFLVLTKKMQILLAILCWVATMIGFGACIILSQPVGLS